MFKKAAALILAVLTVSGLLFTGCDSSDTQRVYVESVAEITGTGYTGLSNRYSGMIVSGSTQKINKDKDKKILDLNVSVGDYVESGDVLFSYDVQAVELALKRLELECEQLENNLVLLNENIKTYKKKVDGAKGSAKLEYEVQLQSYTIEQQEDTLELTAKKSEIARTEEMLDNSDVVSKVSGIVQSINENAGDMDESGEVIPYITLIETGSYRVKCTVSELDVNSIREGSPVIIRSRVDDSTWTGAVEYIEWDNPEKQQNDYMNPEGSNSASRYPFYVTLDSTDGLIMGQHVYVEPDPGKGMELMLPEYYIVDAESDPWVWAANKRDRIEKRTVELGEYNPDLCCYEIISGLSAGDYIAFPDESVSAGAAITHEQLPENEEFAEDDMITPEEEMNGSEEGGDLFDDPGLIYEEVILG